MAGSDWAAGRLRGAHAGGGAAAGLAPPLAARPPRGSMKLPSSESSEDVRSEGSGTWGAGSGTGGGQPARGGGHGGPNQAARAPCRGAPTPQPQHAACQRRGGALGAPPGVLAASSGGHARPAARRRCPGPPAGSMPPQSCPRWAAVAASWLAQAPSERAGVPKQRACAAAEPPPKPPPSRAVRGSTVRELRAVLARVWWGRGGGARRAGGGARKLGGGRRGKRRAWCTGPRLPLCTARRGLCRVVGRGERAAGGGHSPSRQSCSSHSKRAPRAAPPGGPRASAPRRLDDGRSSHALCESSAGVV